MIEILTIPVSSIVQNCRLVWVPGQKEALVVDPGGHHERIVSALEEHDLELSEIWLTHSHLDHCGGVQDLLEQKSVPLTGHKEEAEFRERVEDLCRMYGIPAGEMRNCPEPTRYLEGGEQISFGGMSFDVLFTPGHSPGHLCFYSEALGVVFGGDTIFAGSIGRTDLPRGDHGTLIKSIREKLLTLPDETRVLSGHGPDTTIGAERQSNPYLQGG